MVLPSLPRSGGQPGAHRFRRLARGRVTQGDFAAAEQGWRQAVAADPADSTGRENLSLAFAPGGPLARSGRGGRGRFCSTAGGFACAGGGFLRRRDGRLVPEPLAAFISPGPMQWLARQASPAVWQRVLVAAALLAAAALGLLLRLGYGRAGGRGVQRAAYAALAAAVLLAGAALAGQRAFGVAGDPAAVVVWRSGSLRSVPTEADTDQKTSPLPPAAPRPWTSAFSAGSASASATAGPAGCGGRTSCRYGNSRVLRAAGRSRPPD